VWKLFVIANDNCSFCSEKYRETACDIAKMIDQSADFIQILSTMRKLERMADRSVNIVQLMIFARVGGEMKTY
jgi:phosphate uptake regulator